MQKNPHLILKLIHKLHFKISACAQRKQEMTNNLLLCGSVIEQLGILNLRGEDKNLKAGFYFSLLNRIHKYAH